MLQANELNVASRPRQKLEAHRRAENNLSRATRGRSPRSGQLPIVVSGGTDPVKLGLVASLSQPGGNMTSLFLPRSRRSGWGCCMRWLPKPRPWPCLSTRTIRELKARCETCRRRRSASGELVVLRANTNSDFGDAFATLVQQHAGALLVCTSPFFNSRREQLIMLAARHAVPAMYEFREFASAGGLITPSSKKSDSVAAA